MTKPGHTFIGYRIVDGKQIPIVVKDGDTVPTVELSECSTTDRNEQLSELESGQVVGREVIL